MGCSSSSTSSSGSAQPSQDTKTTIDQPNRSHTTDPALQPSATSSGDSSAAVSSPLVIKSSRSELPIAPERELDEDDLGVAQKPEAVKIAQWSPDPDRKVKHESSQPMSEQEIVQIEEIDMEINEQIQVEKNQIEKKQPNQCETGEQQSANSDGSDGITAALDSANVPVSAPLAVPDSASAAGLGAPLKVSRGLSTRSVHSPEKKVADPALQTPIKSRSIQPEPVPAIASSPSQIFAFDFLRSLAFIRSELGSQTMDEAIKQGKGIDSFVSSVQSEWSDFDLDLNGSVSREEFIRSAWVNCGRDIESFPKQWKMAEEEKEIKEKADEMERKARGDEENEEEQEEEEDQYPDDTTTTSTSTTASTASSLSFWRFVNRRLRDAEYQIHIEPPDQPWAKPYKM